MGNVSIINFTLLDTAGIMQLIDNKAVITMEKPRKPVLKSKRRVSAAKGEKPEIKKSFSFQLEKTFFLLESIGKRNISKLLEQCRSLDMIEEGNANRKSNSAFPEIDRKHLFYRKIKKDVLAIFEILEKDGLAPQAGIQLIYPPESWLAHISHYHREVIRILERNYGQPVWINLKESGVLSFKTETVFCYLSELKMKSKNVLTVRVASKAFWSGSDARKL
jgi:hypothetical protein